MIVKKFSTIYDRVDYSTPSGSLTVDILEKKKTGEKKLDYGYEYDYKQEYDSDGNRSLVICGRHNVYAKIQSFKDDVDIYKILDKYMNGDLSALDRNKGFYADVSHFPKSFSDLHNKIVEGHQLFDSLPTDFKSQFGNNINTFMKSIYDKSFEEKFNSYKASKNHVVPASAPASAPAPAPVPVPVTESEVK